MRDGEVDIAATEALRRELQRQRDYFKVVATERDDLDDRVCRQCLLSRADAALISAADGDLVEYVGAVGPPLRAWLKVDDDGRPGSATIGPLGRKALGVADGDTIGLRALRPRP